ncbi:MAG: hypothetical protein ACI9FD_004002 [Gammaproteobacteria bacterium]|jgi:uncharacterized protein YegP (UPF0339 family)
MPGKFELYTDKGGKIRFRLKASNGQTILASQGYKSKPGAINGIASVQRNAQHEERFTTKDTKGKFMFNLVAVNGQIVGTSERYDTSRACIAAIKSVAKNSANSTIDDQT